MLKKIISYLLIIFLIFQMLDINIKANVQAETYGVPYEGQMEEGVYNISTIEQMRLLSEKTNTGKGLYSGYDYKGSTFYLLNDLEFDITEENNLIPIGYGFGMDDKTISFNGTFDGLGHAITGLNMNAPKCPNLDSLYCNVALFGFSYAGKFKNIIIKDSKFAAYNNGAAILAEGCSDWSGNPEIYNCSTKNVQLLPSKYSSYACLGYILGYQVNTVIPTKITNCYNESDLIVTADIINNCPNLRSISFGGIVSNGCTIDNCYNAGNIYVDIPNNSIHQEFSLLLVNGITHSEGKITNTYNTGKITKLNMSGINNSISNSHVFTFSYNTSNNNKGNYDISGFDKWTTREQRHYNSDGSGQYIVTTASDYNLGIIGFDTYYTDTTNYFLKTSNTPNVPYALSAETMKTQNFIDNYLKSDSYMLAEGRNNGFPILKWQYSFDDIKLTGNNAIEKGNTSQIVATLLPDDIFPSTANCECSIADNKIAVIQSTNKNVITIKAIKGGITDLTVKVKYADFKPVLIKTIQIIVIDPVLTYSSMTVEEGNKIDLILSVAKFDNIDWNTSNASIASVLKSSTENKAFVMGNRQGKVIISAIVSINGLKFNKSIEITVTPKISTPKAGYYLIGQKIIYDSDYSDEENDALYRKEYKYIHNPNILSDNIQLDNSLGTVNYNDTWLGDSVNTFSKVGTYSIYVKAQDNPPTANTVGFEKYRYYSNDVSATIYIHRKPTASYTITNNKVTDTSYDLDHSVSRADKGIVTWEWSYINSNGVVKNCISTNYTDKGIATVNNWLNSYKGVNYELMLRVQDMEYVWSDIFSTSIKGELNMTANLRTELTEFDLVNGVPASENLLAFDVWTKYYKDLKLELVLCNTAGTAVAPAKTVSYSKSTGSKMGQETYWNDIIYNIPRTLKSNVYIMKIKAIDTSDSSIFKEMSFSVNVKTPINLQPGIDSEIKAGYETLIKAKTSKYVNSSYAPSGVKVNMFDGTSYERTIILNGSNTNWQINKTFEKTIPSGTYKAKFTATLPSGEFEIKELNFKYKSNTPPVIDDVNILADIDSSYIYENDDVSLTLKCHDDDFTNLSANIQLYRLTDLASPIKTITKTIVPSSGVYDPLVIRLIDDILIGDYRVVVTVTDDNDETATTTKDFTAHDLFINGEVDHTTKWNENRQTYNSKYPSKARSDDTYWNGEAFETSADTTVIVLRDIMNELFKKTKKNEKI